MHEPELFETYYAMNRPHTSPMMWKIVGAALAFHLVALITLSQFNLLQTKACESPYVGKVCEALDAVYVSSVFLGTDRTSVAAPYEKTELEDADITFIDVSSSEPKFAYPEGYFEPDENDLAMTVDPMGNPITDLGSAPLPGFPNSVNIPSKTTVNPVIPTMPKMSKMPKMPKSGNFGGSGIGKNQKLPPPAGKVITSDDLKGFDVTASNPTVGKNIGKKDKNNTPKVISTTPLKNESPKDLPDLAGNGKNPTLKPTPKVEVKPQTSDSVAEVDINKQPLTDLANMVFAKLTAKEVDLAQPFTVVMNGTLTKEGRFDATRDSKTRELKSQFTKADGDAKTVDIVQQAIEALGDSGWLGYLRNLGVEKVNFTLIQDNDNLRAVIVSDFPNPEKANTVSSGFRGLVQGALLADKTGLKKIGEDEKMLLNSAKVTSDGKNFVLNVVIPKAQAQALIQRKLQENEAKAKAATTPQSNSVSANKNANIALVK